MQTVFTSKAFRIYYTWQEMDPDATLSGKGVIHYDAHRQAYGLHNCFAESPRRLDYLLDEAGGHAWVSEWRDGLRQCSVHRTGRRVEMHRHLTEGQERGMACVLGQRVRIIEWREVGNHDRWLWFVAENGLPLRFLTWTHHERILILHDVTNVERDVRFVDADFLPQPDWNCPDLSP